MDVVAWGWILFDGIPDKSNYYFLNIGQGDSELLIFKGGAKLLIDGGPDGKILNELARVLPAHDRYIDMILMTHPQLDHMGGFADVIRNYKVGVFLGTGRRAEIGAYSELIGLIKEKNIPYVFLEEGDDLRYGDISIEVLSPSRKMIASPELNDGSIILMIKDGGVKSLFVGDAGDNIESILAKKYDLDADILKVGHHGSRFSSSAFFLAEVTPKISVIEVGKNRYGHPTSDTLKRLAVTGALIFRTDLNGTIRLTIGAGKISAAALR